MSSPLNKSYDSSKSSFNTILEILDPEATGYIDLEELVNQM